LGSLQDEDRSCERWEEVNGIGWSVGRVSV
jgi:hypothetical protein